MTRFLLCTLYAPLASWGEIAPGEARSTWDRPSRSAVFGLLAAALGLTRDDQTGHDELDKGLGLAVRLDAPGRALEDYHTSQSVAESVLKKANPATRKTMLEAGARETSLSRRTYRADSLATIALWTARETAITLDRLRAALRAPRFTLCAGRKSNPFGLPLDPEIVDADTLAAALAQRLPPGARLGDLERLKPLDGWGREVAHDPANGFSSGLQPLRRETRRDAAAQRTGWIFANRTVEIGLVRERQP